jgi:hypothetical protein
VNAQTTDAARGLTIHQPWAFAIGEGFKTVENRTWPAPAKFIGSRILIHAGLKHDDTVSIVQYSRDAAIRLDELGGRANFWDARAYIPSQVVKAPHATLALGAIIATARLAACHFDTGECCAPWGEREVFHWQLEDIQPLTRAIPYKGAQQLWIPTPAALDAVRNATGDQ